MATKNISTFSQLKSAIEDADTTEIIVESDITFESGAQINPAKGSLIIDFNKHTVTDLDSSILTDTIYVQENSPQISITVKNASWSGHNLYGIIGVNEPNTEVSLIFENITFEGPHFAYNTGGSVEIKNCDIVIDKNASALSPQELCEANEVTILGSVVVNSNAQTNGVISLSGASPTLTIEENANLEVNALYTHFFNSDNPPKLLFKKASTTFINTKSGLFPSESQFAKSITLQENATFSASRNSASNIALLRCMTDFSLADNSSFALYSPEISSSPLLEFTAQANMSITTPKRVVLYNNGSKAINFQAGDSSSPNTISITTQMLRFWDMAKTPITTAGGFDDAPSKEYYTAYYNQDLFTTITTSPTQILLADSNLIALDEGYPLDNTIPLLTAHVISMGQMTLNPDPITDISPQITGDTDAYANVIASFDGQSISAKAGSNGDFSIPLSSQIPPSTRITLSANKDFLTKGFAVVSEGSLSITRLPQLDFYGFPANPPSTTIYRVDTDWSVEVTDTRDVGNEWYLYAYINSTLTSGSNMLAGALVFKGNAIPTPLSSTPILVYTGLHDKTQPVTTIKWEKTRGFLLTVDTGQKHVPGVYSTYLHWEVLPYKLN